MKTALKGTFSSPTISPLGGKGKVPDYESQTARPAAGRERQTGRIWDGPGDGNCRTGQKSVRLEMKLSWVTSALQCRCSPVTLLLAVVTTLLGMTKVWVTPHKAAPGFTFSTVTAHPAIDVFLFKHCFLECFSPQRRQQPIPSSLDHSKPLPIWIINSLVWGVELKAVFLGRCFVVCCFFVCFLKLFLLFLFYCFHIFNQTMENGFKRNPEGTSMMLNEKAREISWSTGTGWSMKLNSCLSMTHQDKAAGED